MLAPGVGASGVPLRGSGEFGVERDIGFEQAGDGAACFRFGGDLVEFRLVDVGDFRREGEVGFGDGPTGGLHLFEGDVGAGFDAIGGEAAFAEHGGESHRETAGVSSGDEFFGVGAVAVFEAGTE